MVPTGGYRYDAPVSAVADLGNGLYAAYLTGLYVDPGSVYEGGYHMILQKTPQGSDLPYQILLLEEGTPTATEVAALKNRVLDSNTQYDYEKIASFQTEEEYLDYLRERAPAPGARVYLSLGKKEEKVRSPRYARVGDGVRQAHGLLAERLGAENVRLQWFDGGHGTEPARRMLEGLKWLLARP